MNAGINMNMVFTRQAYEEIQRTVGELPSETGGILLGNRDDFIVQKFIFDSSGSRSAASYDPDINSLNKIIKKEWKENQLALIGFIHSHPRGISRLSGDWGGNIGDVGYIKAIFNAIEALDKFLVPIVYSTADGGEYDIFPYIAERGNEENYKQLSIEIIDNYEPLRESISENNKQEEGDKKKFQNKGLDKSKLVNSIDTELIGNSNIVCVGIGGASGICEDLVRIGVGTLTTIDFDKVDESNITTQGFFKKDVGEYKVDALGKRIKDINPDCNYTGIIKNFLEMEEEEIYNIIKDADLILYMTDDFYAQKRGNLFSLKYKKPAIFAIMYDKARCAEITFNIPGVTPACHRCATSPRYKQYEEGYENIITSNASTIFQTHYLNSCIGMIALAIIHNEVPNVEFGNWFGNNWERNLVQLRLNNNYLNGNSLFQRTFNTPEAKRRTFTFDSIWQTIEPEKPPNYVNCPDCNGNGNLNKIVIDKPI